MSAPDWQTVTLGSLAHIRRGSSPRPISLPRWFDSRSDVGWVRIGDVADSDGRTLRSTTQRLSSDGIARSRLLRPGTLIMSIAATVGRPVITGFTTCIHDGFVSFEQLRGVEREFLFYVLKGLEESWSSSGQTGSQTNINTSIVSGRQVAIPADRAEQRRIAEAIDDADRLLVALERLIAKKQAIKQALMQQLLAGRTRLPGFSEPWSEVAVGAVAVVTMGQSPPGSSYNTDGDGTPLVQGNADIRDRATVDRIWTTEPTKLCGAGDVVLTVRAPVGYTAVASSQCSLGRGVCALSAGVNNRFLFHALVYAEPKWMLYEQGSTFTAVNSNEVRAFKVYWPGDQAERLAIGEVLDDADGELRALRQRLLKARNIKGGMTQQLLTGRTRLPVKESVA